MVICHLQFVKANRFGLSLSSEVCLQKSAAANDMAVVKQQEACYAALGKAFSQSNSYNQKFEDWFSQELRFLLQGPAQCTPETLGARLLNVRATILLGACFSALPLQLWQEALSQLVHNLHHPDVVVKLTSVVALSMLLFEILTELEVSSITNSCFFATLLIYVIVFCTSQRYARLALLMGRILGFPPLVYPNHSSYIEGDMIRLLDQQARCLVSDQEEDRHHLSIQFTFL